MKRDRRGRHLVWNIANVRRVQARVKQDLDAAGKSGFRARLRHALQKVRALSDQQSDDAALEQYVYLVSALVHHRRHGGLTESQVEGLLAMGELLLRKVGIPFRQSRLAFLYGDLFLVASGIHSVAGDPWLGAWEQQLAFHAASESFSGGAGYASLARGVAFLRLGNSREALEDFESALKLGVPDEALPRLRLEQVRAKRLRGELERLRAASADNDVAIDWQYQCADAQRTGEVSPLVLATRRGSKFHALPFALEAFLWSRAVRSREWLGPKTGLGGALRGLVSPGLARTPLYRAARCLENVYDDKTPLSLRLVQLGQVVGERHRLADIEHEVVLLAAASRWLFRVRADGFLRLALTEYRHLSLRLTDGRSIDCLGCLGDVFDRVQGESDLQKNRGEPAVGGGP